MRRNKGLTRSFVAFAAVLVLCAFARGQAARLEAGKPPQVIASLGETKELAAFIRNDDWNELHLVARGNVLVHILNGHVMSVVIDEDARERRLEGLLGVQVHVGPPMKIEFRHIRLKKLAP